MKNKKTLYILLPLVALIWGLIFFRIIKQIRKSPESDISYLPSSINDMKEEMKIDTFVLVANYRDPFLGLSGHSNINNSERKPAAQTSKQGSNERLQRSLRNRMVRWPSINYNGLVSSESKHSEVALININNQNFLMKKGDVCEQVTLINIFPDSVVLSYMDQTQTFTKGGR